MRVSEQELREAGPLIIMPGPTHYMSHVLRFIIFEESVVCDRRHSVWRPGSEQSIAKLLLEHNRGSYHARYLKDPL